MRGALDGIKVIDLCIVLAARYVRPCTLAEYWRGHWCASTAPTAEEVSRSSHGYQSS